jgi:hypothetical protein
VIRGFPPPLSGVDAAYAPRRTVLDRILVDAAAGAGVELRTGFSARELLFQGERVHGIRGRSRDNGVVEELGQIPGPPAALRCASVVVGSTGGNAHHRRAYRTRASAGSGVGVACDGRLVPRRGLEPPRQAGPYFVVPRLTNRPARLSSGWAVRGPADVPSNPRIGLLGVAG